ncbi:MAG: beta-ketoacyl synthase chain length factor [Crocinitomicaceae bacterium]|nr:beta-ketoacyl synthase chain length factor [Crocinitomicaceae bacterium]
MYYIHAISSISHQDSFRSENIFDGLQILGEKSEPIAPAYKEFIPPTSLRRLSPVLRMGLTASIECRKTVDNDFDAISVGTALGCLRDTEKFLTTILTTTSDFLSPTAFIQSTHNTIGGQISLGLGNHAYNMTHTQNNLSFEVAMIDAILCVDEGKKNVLVGAADEHIPFLELLQPDLISDKSPLTSGASFFAISSENNKSNIGVKAVYTNFNTKDVETSVREFLAQQGLEISDLDLVLSDDETRMNIPAGVTSMNYLAYSGTHYSAPAFAVHIAHDYLASKDAKYVLVVNEMCKGKLGLTLIQKG